MSFLPQIKECDSANMSAPPPPSPPPILAIQLVRSSIKEAKCNVANQAPYDSDNENRSHIGSTTRPPSYNENENRKGQNVYNQNALSDSESESDFVKVTHLGDSTKVGLPSPPGNSTLDYDSSHDQDDSTVFQVRFQLRTFLRLQSADMPTSRPHSMYTCPSIKVLHL